MKAHQDNGQREADQGENIIPDSLKLVPTEEEKKAEKDRKNMETIASGLAGEQESVRARVQTVTTIQQTSEEAKEAASETPPKIPSMSVKEFLQSKASDKDKEKRIQQLASGKTYRFEKGQKVQLIVKIVKKADGTYEDDVEVTKTTADGKAEKKTVKLSALKLQIWEREGKPSPLEQNKNVTYRHQDGTVTDKMKFIGRNGTTGEYWFQKEPIPALPGKVQEPYGVAFAVAPQDVRVCREQNEDGTIKEKGKFAITREVAQEKPTDTTKPTPAAPPENQTLRQRMEKVLAIEDKNKQREALTELIDQEVEKRMKQRNTDIPPAAAATPAAPGEGPTAETPKAPSKWKPWNWEWKKGWQKVKNFFGKFWRRKAETEEEEKEKEEPEEKTSKHKKTSEGTTREKPERVEYARLDLNTATQRTIDALKELKIKEVAWTQKGTDGSTITYFGVLPFPLVPVKDSRGRECIKVTTTHEESANGELKEAVKTFLIPLAGKKGPPAAPAQAKPATATAKRPAVSTVEAVNRKKVAAPEGPTGKEVTTILRTYSEEQLTELKKLIEGELKGELAPQGNRIQKDFPALYANGGYDKFRKDLHLPRAIDILLAERQFPWLQGMTKEKATALRNIINKNLHEKGGLFLIPLAQVTGNETTAQDIIDRVSKGQGKSLLAALDRNIGKTEK